MTSKIGLDQALVEKARTSARKVAEDTQRFIDLLHDIKEAQKK